MSSEAKMLEQFAANPSLSLGFHDKVYGDDDDLPTHGNWVVWEETGSINDREWLVRGFGPTPLAALRAACGGQIPAPPALSEVKAMDWGDDIILEKLARKTADRDPTKYIAMITVSEANQAAEHIRRLRAEVEKLMLQCEILERRNEIGDDMVERAFIAANEVGMEDPSLMASYAMMRAALTAALSNSERADG